MKTVNVIYMATGADGRESETCMNIRMTDEKAKLITEQDKTGKYDQSIKAMLVLDDVRRLIRCAEKLKGRTVDSMSARFIKGVELVEGEWESLLL